MKMKSNLFRLLFVLTFISFSLGIALPVTAATTWTVDDDGGEDFMTISAAVAAAVNGDTIEVYDGTYYEHVVVNKELTIVAAAGNNPVVDGTASGTCFGIYHGTGLSNVTIEGFEIKNAIRGVWVYGAPSTYHNITITNNDIHNHTQNGILVTDCTVNGLTISSNSIDSSGIGISFANNSTVNGLVINRNIATNNNVGVALWLGTFSNVTVNNCYFQGNAWEHIDLGVTWTGPASITDASITRCKFLSGPWCGVYAGVNTLTNIQIHFNEFLTNQWGVYNDKSSVVDATCNWWGAIDGPRGVGPGSGDAVSANVYYEPWLLSSEGLCYGFVEIADCFQNAKNHGQFVSCIAKITQSWVKDGTITAEERTAIVNWAAQSDISK